MLPVQEQQMKDGVGARSEINLLQGPSDFSLVLGGPLYQLFRRTRLEGDHLELLYRRLFVITSIAWLPLLLLATIGPFAGSAGRLSFLRDVEVHARFLVALPILIAAELLVNARLTPIVRRFIDLRIILPADLPRFNRAVESALRLRNSVALEIALVACVYIFGLWLWNGRVVLGTAT